MYERNCCCQTRLRRRLSLDTFINAQTGVEYGTPDVVMYLLRRRFMKPKKLMLLVFLTQYDVEGGGRCL